MDRQLHFMGRADFQIKVRGQRVEVAEIEQIIFCSSSSVNDCVVVKQLDDQRINEDYLVAYVQLNVDGDQKQIILDSIRSYCLKSLPSYMIPSAWLIMDTFPLNSNGKLDRKRLPKLKRGVPFLPPANDDGLLLNTPLERQLSEIFIQSFNVANLDWNMSFGHQGGTSLGAMKVVSLIRQQAECSNTV
ncbi:unnamed protein product [Didymodactylos carnosus]|nr:unnamed protein product [Didymodactylos carnosus]CAF3549840.1 unnamed protein product [Didymodactylos carnosus]